MFAVEAFPATELGNASFLVADRDHGVGLVVDPYRDVDGYLTRATSPGIKLTHALDTHLHNDFVSGGGELAAEAGTLIDDLEAGQELAVGSLTLRALSTPGHTPDHKSYLLLEGGRPRALFSGGAVMVGAIARTDLFGPHLAVHLALEALRTLQVRLRGLPDDLAIFPTHGAGSFCGTGGKSGHETTLGHERATNPFFLTTEVMPFLARALNQQRYPGYYRDMAAFNSAGPVRAARRPAPPPKLSASQVERLMAEGAAVVDVRRGRNYDRGHIPGSYSVGLDGPFSAWVGWLIPRGRTIVLAGGTDAQHREAQRQLFRVGFESVADARDEHEWSGGHVPGALHIYVPDVPHRAVEIPLEAPVAVHCASGYRAGIAASLLEQAGW